MSVYAASASELAAHIKNKEPKIIVEGNAKDATIRIEATGDVAWLIAFAAIAGAIALYISTLPAGAVTAGVGAFVTTAAGTLAAGGAITLLGTAATAFLIALGVSGGGPSTVQALRNDYSVVKSDGVVALVRN